MYAGINLQFPYVFQAQYEIRKEADYPFTIPLCIKTRVMLSLLWLNCLCHRLKTPTGHKGGIDMCDKLSVSQYF